MERHARQRSDRRGDAARPGGDFDVTLIRWMLSLTPLQRLEVLQSHVESIQILRDAIRK
jgi:hypothetical protein